MRQNQCVIKGAITDTCSLAKCRFIINSIFLALEAAFLQWVEGELSTRMPISIETIVTCVKLLGVGLPKHCWTAGGRPIAI